MMTRFGRIGRLFMLALVGLAVVLAAPAALADKIHLKDGRVLEGRIERESNGNVWFITKIGRIEHRDFFTADQIVKIERDEGKAEAAKPAVSRAERQADARSAGSATRVAILNFGAPSGWQGEIDDMVGLQINAKGWEDAIPLLEKDKIDVVVVRINSGGGMLLEIERFHKLFENEYKPRFRTVAWVESAISAAAMAPWVLEEFYFMPEGNLGACTGWFGALQAVKDVPLEIVLAMMEDASRKGKRDYRIMRSMQIQEPLSASFDKETGEVIWTQDTNGEYIVNPPTQILTFNSRDAVRFKFALAEAATIEELCRAMGLSEWVIAGHAATAVVDKSMREADRSARKVDEVYNKYMMALGAAQSLGGDENRQRRGAEVARARRFLHELRGLIRANPNFEVMYGNTDEWFEEQERILRNLMR